MVQLVFIQPRGGLTTTEQIYKLIQQHPQGITVRELSNQLNRPISMINICLKNLTSQRQLKVKLSTDGLRRIYFPYTMKKKQPCHHCEGLGYIIIRDCTGEIQREETCSFCYGTGERQDYLNKSTEPPKGQ